MSSRVEPCTRVRGVPRVPTVHNKFSQFAATMLCQRLDKHLCNLGSNYLQSLNYMWARLVRGWRHYWTNSQRYHTRSPTISWHNIFPFSFFQVMMLMKLSRASFPHLQNVAHLHCQNENPHRLTSRKFRNSAKNMAQQQCSVFLRGLGTTRRTREMVTEGIVWIVGSTVWLMGAWNGNWGHSR